VSDVPFYESCISIPVAEADIIEVDEVFLHFKFRIVDPVFYLGEIDFEACIFNFCFGNKIPIGSFTQNIKGACDITIDIRKNGSQEPVEVLHFKIGEVGIDPVAESVGSVL
jgi:hypothetical protein